MNSTRMVVWNQRSPTIYRYLEKEFVEDFFEKGELRLSSFKRFKKHKDEQRKDTSEGSVTSCVAGSDFTVYANTEHGSNALILSTSQVYENGLFDSFNVDSCFSINNVPQFGLAICKTIPGCIAGIEGSCIYDDKRVIQTNAGVLKREDFGIDNSNSNTVMKPTDISQEEMNKRYGNSLQIALGDDPLFLKMKNHSPQREYRLIWFLELEKEAPEILDIKCPEAVQFCTRMD